jgi:hypothetical protein
MKWGQQYGTALKDAIIQAIVDYKANVQKLFGRENADAIFDWVLNQAGFKVSIEQYLPHALDELRGIADASGVTLERMLRQTPVRRRARGPQRGRHQDRSDHLAGVHLPPAVNDAAIGHRGIQR